MSSGSSLLIIAGIIFFTNLILNFNRTASTQEGAIYENESYIYGESLVQSILEELETRNFDENTIAHEVKKSARLTKSNSLAPDDAESSIFEFDDIDDFNGFILVDSLSGHGIYNCTVEVYYVDPDYPEAKSNNAFFSKRVDIVLTNTYLMHDITISKIYSY